MKSNIFSLSPVVLLIHLHLLSNTSELDGQRAKNRSEKLQSRVSLQKSSPSYLTILKHCCEQTDQELFSQFYQKYPQVIWSETVLKHDFSKSKSRPKSTEMYQSMKSKSHIHIYMYVYIIGWINIESDIH